MDGPRRFYGEVGLLPRDDGFAVALDGRVAKSAGRHALIAPRGLAEALAGEWRAQGETIRLETMPLTRIHGFVLDAGEAGRAEFIDTIVRYAGSDLLCYRAGEPDLAGRQEALFGPFLDRAACDGFRFSVTEGLLPVEQPAETLDAIRRSLEARSTTEIFPRKLLTEILGSAVLALYAEKDPENAFAAARLDEAFQAEKWGRDREAEDRERALERDYQAVLTYLQLAHSPT